VRLRSEASDADGTGGEGRCDARREGAAGLHGTRASGWRSAQPVSDVASR
jgi:hypothetical protein